MTETKKAAAQALINLRGKAGLTQKGLADSAGVTERTISNFENGEVWPRAATLSKLETALGLEGGYFQRFKNSDVYAGHEAHSVVSESSKLMEVLNDQKSDVERISDLDLLEELKRRLLSADRDRNWLMQQINTSGERVEELEDELAEIRSALEEQETQP